MQMNTESFKKAKTKLYFSHNEVLFSYFTWFVFVQEQ